MNKPSENILTVAAKVQNYLEFISQLGFTGVDCSEPALAVLASWGQGNNALSDIAARVRQCRKCRLARPGRQGMMGAGQSGARVMFIRGWPTPEDCTAGTPCSGADGELLSRIIQAMSLNRNEVYITCALKCMPPPDMSPTPEEIQICSEFVKQEIHAVRPAIICTLGEAAAHALGEPPSAWEAHRGRFHYYSGIPVMPTYAPEYLLAHPSAKRATWDDIKQVIQKLKAL